MTKPESILKNRDIILLTKVHIFKAIVFPVLMCGCKSFTIKRAEHQGINAFVLCCWRRLLRLLETEVVHPKGNHSWIFIGRTDDETEAPILWPPDAKNQLIGKDPDAWKDWRQDEKAMTEDEMVGWHHQLNGHEFEQILGDSKGQGSLVCWNPWGHKELDMT